MKIIFISKNGDIIPLAQRVEQEGNDVSFFLCRDEEIIVDKHITDHGPELIVIDSPGFGSVSTRLKKKGFPVLGGSLLTDKLSSDDIYNMSIFQMCGLAVTSHNGVPYLKVDVEGWFNGKGFANIIYTLDSVVFAGMKQDKIFKDGLGQLAPALARSGYTGPIWCTTFINKDNAYHVGLYASFSASTILAMREGLKGRVTDTLYGMATGVNRMYMFKPGWFTAVELVLNPGRLFNDKHYDEKIEGISEDVMKHIWLYGVTAQGTRYLGKGGRIAVVTARGDTIREARRRVYRTIHNISIPNVLYLEKVGDKATGQHAQIKSWGYIT